MTKKALLRRVKALEEELGLVYCDDRYGTWYERIAGGLMDKIDKRKKGKIL